MSALNSAVGCPGCGAALSTAAPEGLCPRCLFGTLINIEKEEPQAAAAERFGEYELLGVIARGGSGLVHRARHVELDRMVALKILPPELSGEEEFLARFRTEAAAAASLEHPHIVPVYDFGAHQGRHFLAMKLIEGASAAQRMAPREAAARLITVARAVHHAHQRGVLHRDLKPGNILLDAQGIPHLTDFGLAKLITREATITRTRAVLGTPAYMAPEQAEGKNREITTSADVYGLGALLYHWLTGGPPFAGGTTLETIRQVLETGPEPPSRKAPGINRDLETICLKCLRKEPGARYSSADALAADLDRWQRGEPVMARPVRTLERLLKWGRRNKALALVTAAAVLVLLSASLILWGQNVQLTAARGKVAELAEDRRRELVKLYVETGNRLAAEGDGYAALSSFADAAALDASDPARLAMHRFRFAATQARLPAREQAWRHSGPVFSAGFSSDGTRTVTASADGTVRVWNAATGDAAVPPLTHSGPVWWAGFAAGDARVLSRTKSGEISLWDAATGAPCAGPFKGREDLPEIRDALARAVPRSPRGDFFAVPGNSSLEVRRAGDGSLFLTLPVSQPVSSAAWSADGSLLAVACENGEALTFDAQSGDRRHALPPGLVSRSPDAPVGWRSVAWSPDGTHLSFTDRVFAARIIPADLSGFSATLTHQHMVMGTAWTRDGSRLLTWSYDNTLRLWETAAQRPVFAPVRLGGPVHGAALSPDETWVAAASRDGTVSLHDPATGERRGALLRHDGMVLDAAWSRDGSRLITAGTDGLAQLWKVTAHSSPGSECRHSGSVEQLAISPDGTLVAALALQPDVVVWRMPAGVSAATLPHGAPVASAAWLSHTTLLTLTADATLRTWDVSSGKLTSTLPMPAVAAEALISLRLSPDGRHLAVAFKKKPPQLFSTVTGNSTAVLGTQPSLALLWTPCSKAIANVYREGTTNIASLHTLAGEDRPASVRRLPSFPVAMSAGAERLVIARSDYSVQVLTKGSPGPTPRMRHEATVLSAAFTADGRILATGSQDGALRLWDAETAEPLSPPLLHRSWVMCTGAAEDGHHFYTGVNGGILSAWTIPDTDLAAADMKAAAAPPP